MSRSWCFLGLADENCRLAISSNAKELSYRLLVGNMGTYSIGVIQGLQPLVSLAITRKFGGMELLNAVKVRAKPLQASTAGTQLLSLLLLVFFLQSLLPIVLLQYTAILLLLRVLLLLLLLSLALEVPQDGYGYCHLPLFGVAGRSKFGRHVRLLSGLIGAGCRCGMPVALPQQLDIPLEGFTR